MEQELRMPNSKFPAPEIMNSISVTLHIEFLLKVSRIPAGDKKKDPQGSPFPAPPLSALEVVTLPI